MKSDSKSRISRSLGQVIICVMTLLVSGARQLPAQVTVGGVVGTVKDPSGAVVQNARLLLINEATKAQQETESSVTGNFGFAAVPVGTYTLTAEAGGFETYRNTRIQVHVQNTVTIDIQMVTGSVTQQVTVTAAVPLLQAQDASLGQTVPSVQVNDLPLNSRNWLSMILLAAGTVTNPNVSEDNPNNGESINGIDESSVDYRLNGIDDNVVVFGNVSIGNFGGASVQPIPDAIQEFKLQDGDNSAEFGQFAGGVVNAVIKAGTNQFHGDGFEYFRNEALNANDYFNNLNHVRRPEYRQNQFGGTLGGPIYLPHLYSGKDKTFFFVDYQHTGVDAAASFTETVPTNNMRNSSFTNLQDLIADNSGTTTDALGRKFSFGTVLDPATTRSVAPGTPDPVSGFSNMTANTIYVRDPFYTGGSVAGISDFTSLASMLNKLPAGRIDSNAVSILSLLPAPSGAGLTNNYFSAPRYTDTINQYDIRIDQNFGPKDLVWGVFDKSSLTASSYQPFPGIAGGATAISPLDREPHYEIALNYTHIFSPNLENAMTGGYDHVFHDQTLPTSYQTGLPGQYGIQGIPQIAGNGGLPTFAPSGISTFGGRRYQPTIQTTTALQFLDNLILTRHTHEIHLGFEFNHLRANIIQPSYSRGEFDFNGQYSNIPNKNNSLTGIADMLLVPTATTVPNGISNLGGPSAYDGSNFAGTDYFSDYYGAYVQDNWRLTSTLTVNLGLRWDYSSPFGESNGRQANFIASGNGNGNSGTYYIPQKGCSVTRSATFNAILSGYNIAVDCVSGLEANQGQKDSLAPRVGFAYRFLPRLVLRGGYGIAYGAYDSVGYGGTLGTNYPFQYLITNPSDTSQSTNALSNGQTATIENTFNVINLGNPASVTGTGLNLYGKQYHYRSPYNQSVNLTLQDQFTDRDAVQVSYVASLGRNLDAFGVHNSPSQILPPGTNQTQYLPFPTLAPNSQFLQTIAISNYNSLQAVYQHQFKDNLVFLANYTYGKCMTNQVGKTDLTPGGSFRAEWLPGFGIGHDYSVCASDATHVIHVSGEYALPFGQERRLLAHGNRVEEALVGGWNINYIFAYQSGQPFTIACPVATSSDFGCYANLVKGQSPYAGPHNRTQWLNPAAFAEPPAATAIGQTDYSPLGSAADQVRGPGFTNLDSSIFKEFNLAEGTRIEFRAEAFNTLNSAQFQNPSSQNNFTNLTKFSVITADRSGTGRLGQIALKFIF